MQLNEENYYSKEADIAYQSVSQYKSFRGTIGRQGCEARALAELKGEFARPKTSSLLVGSYVDAYFDGSLERFKEEHPEIISTRGANKGQLKTEFRQAEAMIERAKRDPLFMKYMTNGSTQEVFTGEINGCPWKCKLDVYADGVYILDLKTVENLNKVFYAKDLGEHLDFISYWGYDLQLAIYQELVRQNTGEKLPCFIAAISKDKTGDVYHPRLKIINIPQAKMDEKLIEVKMNTESVQMVKDGTVEPIRCEHCDYCADTEILDHVITPDELIMDF